ncbi:peptidyl-tRNA hydrolase [Usnea florida]
MSGSAKRYDDESHREARTWLARFNANTIPKNICEVTFSRSSGPGGQNVNKVNSKATLRIRTQDFMHLIPAILRPNIEASRYYAEKSKSLVIQGDGSRDRTNNVQECYNKLHALIVDAGRSSVRGETSRAQVEKVKNLSVLSERSLLSDKLG